MGGVRGGGGGQGEGKTKKTGGKRQRQREREIYIYIWQQGHLLPTFCSKMPLFPQFYSKNGSNNCPYMDNFFAIFGSSVSVLSINFWRILECEPKKTSFGGSGKNLLLAGEMLKTAKAVFNISLVRVIFIFKKCFWLGKC